MPVTLYTSKLETIGDALAAHVMTAPVFAAESCEAVSRVDDTIGSQIAERVGKRSGLLCVVALQSTTPHRAGQPGVRLKALWNISLWASRAKRAQKNSGPVLYEALLAAVDGWMPATADLCYEEFQFFRGGQQPHPAYSLYEATFSAVVQIAAPVPVA